MTYEESKKYLESLKTLSQKALNKADEIDELRTIAMNCTVQTDKECVQSSGSMDKLANIVGKIEELERQVETIKGIYIVRRKIIGRFSMTYNEKEVAEFIDLRYVQEKGFCVTCAKMNLSETTARRVQTKIIKDFGEYYETHKNV